MPGRILQSFIANLGEKPGSDAHLIEEERESVTAGYKDRFGETMEKTPEADRAGERLTGSKKRHERFRETDECDSTDVYCMWI